MKPATLLHRRWPAVNILLLCCATATCFGLSPQEERELLAAYVPLEFGDESALVTSLHRHSMLRDADNWTLPTSRRQRPSDGQRWVEFEDEYGVHRRSEFWMLSGIQSAKYHVDKTVFALDVLVENVERAVQLEYDVARGNMQWGSSAKNRVPIRTYADPWRDVWENARIKSDVDLDIFSGRAWVGLRLVIPIGD